VNEDDPGARYAVGSRPGRRRHWPPFWTKLRTNSSALDSSTPSISSRTLSTSLSRLIAGAHLARRRRGRRRGRRPRRCGPICSWPAMTTSSRVLRAYVLGLHSPDPGPRRVARGGQQRRRRPSGCGREVAHRCGLGAAQRLHHRNPLQRALARHSKMTESQEAATTTSPGSAQALGRGSRPGCPPAACVTAARPRPRSTSSVNGRPRSLLKIPLSGARRTTGCRSP
jgi:hypothetical protein